MFPKSKRGYAFWVFFIISCSCLQSLHGGVTGEDYDDITDSSREKQFEDSQTSTNSTSEFSFSRLFEKMKHYYNEMDMNVRIMVASSISLIICLIIFIILVSYLCKKMVITPTHK